MSNTDSFIDEVTEEVRRDRLFALIKRYGWVAALAVVLIVGGAAWNEYRKAQVRAQAERLGDALLDALAVNDPGERAAALWLVKANTPQARAIVAFLTAAEVGQSGDRDAAVRQLNAVAVDPDLPEIYRQIATFKALGLQADTLPAAERQLQFEALAQPGSALRLLAEEQLALLDIEEGAVQAAVDRYQAIMEDAEVTPDLQQRALQVIVSLGASPDLENLPQPAN